MSIETQAKPRRSLRDLFGPNATEEAKAITRRAATLSMNDMAKVLNADYDKEKVEAWDKEKVEYWLESAALPVPARETPNYLSNSSLCTRFVEPWTQGLRAAIQKRLGQFPLRESEKFTPTLNSKFYPYSIRCMDLGSKEEDVGSYHFIEPYILASGIANERQQETAASYILIIELNALLTQLGQRNITPDVTVRFHDPVSSEEGELSFGPHAPVGSYYGGSLDYGVQVKPEFQPGFFKR